MLPIMGDSLAGKRVALLGADAGAAVAEALVGCGLFAWDLYGPEPARLDGALVATFGRQWGGMPAAGALAAALHTHYGESVPWDSAILASPDLPHPWPDLAILAGDVSAAVPAAVPVVRLPAGADAEQAHRVAAHARALLAGQSISGDCWAVPLPPEHDPLAALAAVPSAFRTPADLPALRQATVLVIGCGSLGSLAARVLAPQVGRLVLVDGGLVSIYNPVRQLYPVEHVGQPKARAAAGELVARYGVDAVAVCRHVTTQAELHDLIGAYRPDVALVTTGTAADHALARALFAAGVPHLVGRCYPRARYWEAIIVDGQAGPCFGCLRARLYTGTPPPPTPEEAARYAPAPPAGELAAEPATRVDSGWAAACMARLACQQALPPTLRERWLNDLLARGQTCLIGGLHTGAYGIDIPGRIRAYGLDEIIGSAACTICADCGRSWPARYRV